MAQLNTSPNSVPIPTHPQLRSFENIPRACQGNPSTESAFDSSRGWLLSNARLGSHGPEVFRTLLAIQQAPRYERFEQDYDYMVHHQGSREPRSKAEEEEKWRTWAAQDMARTHRDYLGGKVYDVVPASELAGQAGCELMTERQAIAFKSQVDQMSKTLSTAAQLIGFYKDSLLTRIRIGARSTSAGAYAQPSLELGAVEMRRLNCAFLRYDLVCRVNGISQLEAMSNEYLSALHVTFKDGMDSAPLSGARQTGLFLTRQLPADEVEGILCVKRYIQDHYEAIFIGFFMNFYRDAKAAAEAPDTTSSESSGRAREIHDWFYEDGTYARFKNPWANVKPWAAAMSRLGLNFFLAVQRATPEQLRDLVRCTYPDENWLKAAPFLNEGCYGAMPPDTRVDDLGADASEYVCEFVRKGMHQNHDHTRRDALRRLAWVFFSDTEPRRYMFGLPASWSRGDVKSFDLALQAVRDRGDDPYEYLRGSGEMLVSEEKWREELEPIYGLPRGWQSPEARKRFTFISRRIMDGERAALPGLLEIYPSDRS